MKPPHEMTHIERQEAVQRMCDDAAFKAQFFADRAAWSKDPGKRKEYEGISDRCHAEALRLKSSHPEL